MNAYNAVCCSDVTENKKKEKSKEVYAKPGASNFLNEEPNESVII